MNKKHLLFFFLILLTKYSTAQICQVIITHVINGNTVQYSGSSPDNPTNWSWFFNGGSPMTSNQQNVTVTYGNTGTFISALSVFGGPNNCSSSLSNKTDTVTVTTVAVQEHTANDILHIVNEGGAPYFEISCSKAKNVTVQLFSIDGKLIATIFRGVLLEGTNTIKMETFGLSAGNYILTITDDKNTNRSQKFFWKG